MKYVFGTSDTDLLKHEQPISYKPFTIVNYE